MIDKGAASVRGFCTHPLLSGNAIERIEASPFTEVVVTDTIPLRRQSDKIHVISTASLLADVIGKVHNYESISTLFKFD
jgi:ribose-phosphate pyrophosphokinase